MIFTDLTFENPASNIAFEQILLEGAEQAGDEAEYLRIWRPEAYMVVLGRGGKISDDVHLEQCQQDQVPIIRRISGGGTIITGRGCLMYTTVLSLAKHRALQDITYCHQHIASQMLAAYEKLGLEIESKGHSDLCVGDKKFSGNAMRMGRTHLIYHGTLLINFDLEIISRYLKQPPRRPEYREKRDHVDFVRNLAVDPQQLCESIQDVFGAEPGNVEWAEDKMQTLLAERFENPKWNLRF